MPLKGIITTDISDDSKHLSAQFYVADGNSRNLLSYTTACQLSLLQVTINSTTHHLPSTDQYPPEFECLFSGIGKLTGKTVKLHIDPDVSPKQQPHHRIPFHVRSDVPCLLRQHASGPCARSVAGKTKNKRLATEQL